MESTTRSIFASRLKLIRKLQSLSQQELAERSQLSIKAIQRLEAGKQAPSFPSVDRLCDALNIKPGELFQDSELPPHSETLIQLISLKIARRELLNLSEIMSVFDSVLSASQIRVALAWAILTADLTALDCYPELQSVKDLAGLIQDVRKVSSD